MQLPNSRPNSLLHKLLANSGGIQCVSDKSMETLYLEAHPPSNTEWMTTLQIRHSTEEPPSIPSGHSSEFSQVRGALKVIFTFCNLVD